MKNAWITSLIIFQIWVMGHSFAQEVPQGCSNEYEQISESCIRKFANSFGDLKIAIPNNPAPIIENTYFYVTEAGHLGKFTITAGISNANVCSAFLKATTYIKGKSYVPQISLNAKNEFGRWIPDTVSLSKQGAGNLRLSVNKQGEGAEAGSICVLSLEGAKGVFYMNTKEQSLATGKELIYYAALFLIGLAVFLVARAVFQDEERFKASEKLDDADSDKDKNAPEVNDFVLKYSRPFFKRYFSPIVSGMKNKKKIKEKYKRKLATAGLTKDLTPEDFFAFKLFLIIGFPIVFLAVRTGLEETWPLTLTPLMGVIGFFYPDIWVNGRIQRRKEDIVQNMPFVVDMLALSTEAGLDFMAAMQKVIEKAKPSALTQEFEIMIKETRVGASRAEGLRQLSWRTDTIQMASFTATLIAADSVGASIGPILKTLAAEMRQKRSADAEKKGATAATKILFPMMFLIMPSVALIIMAPMMLQFMAG